MKVFISYTTPDEIAAKHICRELKKFFPCWIACEDVIGDHESAIQQELAANDCVMVALISNSTFDSPGQKKEFRIADSFRTETIPVLIDDIFDTLSDVEFNFRNRIPDRRAFVPYVMHSGQYYLAYKDPNWFTKVRQAIHDAMGAMEEKNPVLAKLRSANISTSAFSRKCIQTRWSLGEGQPTISIVFDTRPSTVVDQTGHLQEYVSVRGITRTKGYTERELLTAIRPFKENGRWGLRKSDGDSMVFEMTNAFHLSMSSPASMWTNCCNDICTNLSDVFKELDKPKSDWDDLLDTAQELFDGIVEGFATGLSIAEQLGVFDQEEREEGKEDD